MKIGIIIQARCSSTRLPKKILLKLPYGGRCTVLEQVIARCKLSKIADKIIIATTTDKDDDKIVTIAKKNKVSFFRGSKDDVLSRYYGAAKENKIDVVVRITSDCPFVDYKIIDDLIKLFIKQNADYASNTLKRTFPHGLDAEVFTFKALEKAYFKSQKNYEREHVTPYIYNNSDQFKLSCLKAKPPYNRPDIRITVDTKDDYVLTCAVYDYLYKHKKYFGVHEIINLFSKKPWLHLLNKRVLQKKIFKNLQDELEEAIKILKLQGLNRTVEYISKKIKI